MALPHAAPLEPIDLAEAADAPSQSLVKTGRLQLLRLVLDPDHPQPEHSVDADCVVHCLEGAAALVTTAGRLPLPAGSLVVVPGGERHALAAADTAVVLVTLLLADGDAGDGGGRGAVTLDDADPAADTLTPSRFQA